VEEQLRQNEKLSALGLLAAEVAHEIRNPLTVMKMLYHSLDLKFPANDPRAKDARIIDEKIELLNRIVERILAFARTSEPNLVPVNLGRLIDELGLLVRHKLNNQRVQWIVRTRDNLPTVSGDATQLEQAFLNLILNAVEAMPEGGALTITLRPVQPRRTAGLPSHVMVEFKDTGAGMSEEQRERAFTSLLSTTKRGGTGLGLAIVRRIVEAHHGKLSLQSQPGKGTIIRMMLPRQPEAGE
jgi:signal transduction histidine kinase